MKLKKNNKNRNNVVFVYFLGGHSVHSKSQESLKKLILRKKSETIFKKFFLRKYSDF